MRARLLAFLRRLPFGARRARTGGEDALGRELDFHIQELAAANERAGMDPATARREATLAFGGREQVRQRLRDLHTPVLLHAFGGGLRAALHSLRRTPGFAFTVIATLALGIGANCAVFSAVDAVLLRPLPFPQGDALVQLGQQDTRHRDSQFFVAPQRLEDWNRLNHTFTAISGFYTENDADASAGMPERVTTGLVAPRFLRVLGVMPELGRDFSNREEHFGGPSAAILSDSYWRNHDGGNPHVLNTRIRLGSYSYTVVGVAPRAVGLLYPGIDLWTPSAPDAPYAQSRTSTWFTAIGRMRSGVSLHTARADLDAVQRALGRQYPQTDADLGVIAVPQKGVVLGNSGASLWLLYGAGTLLLLVACTNIATLLLARTAGRAHEVAVRYSLGATRGAVAAALLAEVVLLAAVGSVLALGLAGAAPHLFRLAAPGLPRVAEIAMNGRMVDYTLVCGLGTALLCGLLPAWRGSRRPLAGSLAGGTRTLVSARLPLQWTLVGVQMALAVALLVGAGLLLRSFAALGAVPSGFDPEGVLTLHISGGWGETADLGRLTQRINRDLDALRAVPGVQAAATSASLPGIGAASQGEFRLPGGPVTPDRAVVADQRFVSGGYLRVLRIPLLEGRACTDNPPTMSAMVNRAFARRYFGGRSPVGYHLASVAAANVSPLPSAVILGVVGDAREITLAEAPTPAVYWCTSAPDADPAFLLRTSGDPLALANTVRRAIFRAEPARSVSQVGTLVAAIGGTGADTRLRTALLTAIALLAAMLVAIGLYGTVDYLGRMREGEIGLRLALGAARGGIVRTFLRQSLVVAALGCAAGLGLGAALAWTLRGLLYGISALDGATYAGVVGFVLLVAAGSALSPALRAARVEPTRVLRNG